MCIATPLQIIRAGEVTATGRGRNGEEEVTMLLVGDQPVGTWVLSFLGWAREVISEVHAREIDLALDGLQAIMSGAEAIDHERHFPGLGRSEPEAA